MKKKSVGTGTCRCCGREFEKKKFDQLFCGAKCGRSTWRDGWCLDENAIRRAIASGYGIGDRQHVRHAQDSVAERGGTLQGVAGARQA